MTKLYQIKSLVWESFGDFDAAESPIGTLIAYDDCAEYWPHKQCCDSSAEARQICERWYEEKMAKGLEEVPSGWQPIEEAPKDGTPVLLLHRDGVYCGWWTDNEMYPWHFVEETKFDAESRGDMIRPNAWSASHGPTHFQHIPAPPEGRGA